MRPGIWRVPLLFGPFFRSFHDPNALFLQKAKKGSVLPPRVAVHLGQTPDDQISKADFYSTEQRQEPCADLHVPSIKLQSAVQVLARCLPVGAKSLR
ncbi:MAG: hypothetical protein WCO04_13565 [Pseudomonadota bacterium]